MYGEKIAEKSNKFGDNFTWEPRVGKGI